MADSHQVALRTYSKEFFRIWAREDLNLHGLPHQILSLARLPVSPPAQKAKNSWTFVPRPSWAPSEPQVLGQHLKGPEAEGRLTKKNLKEQKNVQYYQHTYFLLQRIP